MVGGACRFEREGEDFRIRRLPVGAAKTLDARLREFARAAWEKPENRPAIGEARALSSTLRGEIGGQHRNRIFRTQAIVGAGKIACEIELAAQLLAGIEEDRSRLQDRRFTARVSGAGEMGDDAFGALIGKRQRSAPESSTKFASLSKASHVARQILPENGEWVGACASGHFMGHDQFPNLALTCDAISALSEAAKEAALAVDKRAIHIREAGLIVCPV